MKTHHTLLIGVLLIVAACASGAPSPSTAPSEPTPTPPPTTAPDEPVTGVPGLVFPLPGDGGPTNVVPQPGQRDVRPVSVEEIEARVNGDRIAARLTWHSGVEPCYVLDSVLVARSGQTITLTIREGSGPGDVVCIQIAQQKSTIVDLGAFAPGTYTIAASDGPATPVEVIVP